MTQADVSLSTTTPDRGPLPITTVNLSLPSMSRRGILAALAAGAAVNMPAIAVTAAALPAGSASPVAHPDQALLDLGRQYDVALAAEDAACEAWVDAGIAFRSARPARPDILRHRIDDHWEFQFPALGETRWICDTDLSAYYNEAEVEYLRTMQHRMDGGRERGDQVIAAWERQRDECSALAASFGCDKAKAAYYEAVRARQAIGDAIVAARATTLHGLAVRAEIVDRIIGNDEDGDDDGDHDPTDQKMIAAIVRDLIQITT